MPGRQPVHPGTMIHDVGIFDEAVFRALLAILSLPGGTRTSIMRWPFFTLAAVAPWAFIAPAYAVPAMTESMPDDLQSVQITYGEQFELAGYRLPSREVLPGHSLDVELGWRAVAPSSSRAARLSSLITIPSISYGR